MGPFAYEIKVGMWELGLMERNPPHDAELREEGNLRSFWCCCSARYESDGALVWSNGSGLNRGKQEVALREVGTERADVRQSRKMDVSSARGVTGGYRG